MIVTFQAKSITKAVSKIDNPITKLNFLLYFSLDINLLIIFPRNSHVLAVGIPIKIKIKTITERLFAGVSDMSMKAAAIAIATIIAFGFAHCINTPS